jgi:hypothetical protein
MGHKTMQNKLSKEKEDKNPSIQKKDSSCSLPEEIFIVEKPC